MKQERNDIYNTTAVGGSELMYHKLIKEFEDTDLLDNIQIIISRPDEIHLDVHKKKICWLHDTWDDVAGQFLSNPDNRKKIDLTVFCSWYQFYSFLHHDLISYDESFVIRNGIIPFEFSDDEEFKPRDKIRLIYNAAPHKGLQLVVPCYTTLFDIFGDLIHLDIFSNFEMYGEGFTQKNKYFERLYEDAKNHPGITYHGYKPNDVIREYLQKAHILLYPSCFPEQCPIVSLEALSSKTLVVAPKFAGLIETVGDFGVMYPYKTDLQTHANIFTGVAIDVIDKYLNYENNKEMIESMLNLGKFYVDRFYGWEGRKVEWKMVLENLKRIG
jgi:glycosyltransferase involved in cell wall biosynthesis